MRITPNQILSDYKLLRQTPEIGEYSIVPTALAEDSFVVERQIDNDPQTPDRIRAVAPGKAGSGPGSTPTQMEFLETQVEGVNVLEFAVERTLNYTSSELEWAKGSIDLDSGFLLSASNSPGSSFEIATAQSTAPVAPTPPTAPEGPAKLAEYREIRKNLDEANFTDMGEFGKQVEIGWKSFFITSESPTQIQAELDTGSMEMYPDKTHYCYNEIEVEGHKFLDYTETFTPGKGGVPSEKKLRVSLG